MLMKRMGTRLYFGGKTMLRKAVSLILLIILLIPMLCICPAQASESTTAADDFKGKRIGVLTGSVHDAVASRNLEDPVVTYYNSATDLAIALEMGKVDAYVADEPTVRILTKEYPGHEIVLKLSDEKYAYAFRKNDEMGALLCRQMTEFLKMLKKNGTLEEIDAVWFGEDESAKRVDMDGLTPKNGTLTFSVSTDIGVPFVYVKNNHYVGYDVDIAVRFCREYGYGIDIVNSSFDGMLAAVSSGKSDFCGSCITVTPERGESMLFSEPNYSGGTVLTSKTNDAGQRITSLEQLAGTRLGIQTGVAYDQVAEERMPECEFLYFNANADLAVALETGKIQSYLVDEPVARILFQEYPSQRILTILREEAYAWALPKVNPGSEKLCAEVNAFYAQCREDGTFDEIDAIWFGTDTEKQKVDFSGLEPVNGTITMAISSVVGAPFCYIKDKEFAGYDLDLAARFCRAYGYGLRVIDFDIPGMFSCLAAGKCDFSACCIAVTEERKETMLFPDPYYRGGIAVVVSDAAAAVTADEDTGIFASIAESFNKTFIREDRYQLFLSGIGTTLLVVVLSLVFGTVLGFVVYLAYYRLGKPFRTAVNVLMRITENTPVVVILMILYYIIFGKTDVSGVFVAVVGFTLIFAGSVIGVMKVGVGAVDPGQREAALALGYTENQAFMKVILPQAAVHFLPGYKSAIVQLIKGTAIVGYIAVQDLTKVSDIVRSRTYEAFFPLIVTAILYFLMAVLISAVVKRLEIRISPASRKMIRLLKGVKTK